MCGCVEALLRAVVAFFDATLVDCFLSLFCCRPGPNSSASAHQDRLVPKDREGEALPASDEEKGTLEISIRIVDFAVLQRAQDRTSSWQMAMSPMKSSGVVGRLLGIRRNQAKLGMPMDLRVLQETIGLNLLIVGPTGECAFQKLEEDNKDFCYFL